MTKTTSWNLFLDDLRIPPEMHQPSLENPAFWTLAQSSQEAMDLVREKGMPAFMSLDHDLGGDDKSMVFLNWLAYEYWNGEDNIPLYVVHSANPVGAENIESFMLSWVRSMEL